MTSHELQKLIEAASSERKIAPATLCRLAVGNNRLYRTLASGGTCTLDVANRLLAYIKANPAPTKEAAQ